MKYDSKAIDFNTMYLDKLEGSEMKFFDVKLDSKLKDNDLLIDARLINTNEIVFESPVILVSLKPLPNTDKTSQWVCGQLGSESCFVPNKYLTSYGKIYLGVLCESCDFTIKVSYIKEEILKDGENKLIHLKAGDSKVFFLDEFFMAEKEWIQISSFNLKMSNYKMTAQIVEKVNPQNVIEVPVTVNWIGGQQATIKPNLTQYTAKYIYRVILTALENGVFNIEARTSKSVIQLKDNSLKFETVKEGQSVCYSYKVGNNNNLNSVIIEAKSIKGGVSFNVYPQKSSVSNSLNLLVPSQQSLKYELTSEFRKTKEAESGTWIICAEPQGADSFFTIHIYSQKNSESINEYKQLLYQLLKKEEMYDLENIHSKYLQEKKPHNVAIFRNLLQSSEVAIDTNTITETPVANHTPTAPSVPSNVKLGDSTEPEANVIHMNGHGFSGIAVLIIFLIPVLIGSFSLMSIFVNTKFLEQPLRIKIME